MTTLLHLRALGDCAIKTQIIKTAVASLALEKRGMEVAADWMHVGESFTDYCSCLSSQFATSMSIPALASRSLGMGSPVRVGVEREELGTTALSSAFAVRGLL